MKRIALLLTALALPAVAIAKEPVKATVCGPDECTVSKDKQSIVALLRGGPPTGRMPDAGAPSYRVVITIAEGDRQIDTFATRHVPSLRLIRNSDAVWMPMSTAGLAALRRLTKDLRPYPASRLPLTGTTRTPGGALPPQTYEVAPVGRPDPATAPDDGTPWWLIAGLVAGLGALGAGAMRFRGHRTAAS